MSKLFLILCFSFYDLFLTTLYMSTVYHVYIHHCCPHLSLPPLLQTPVSLQPNPSTTVIAYFHVCWSYTGNYNYCVLMTLFTMLYSQQSVSQDSSISSVSYNLSSTSCLISLGNKMDILVRAKHTEVMCSQYFDQLRVSLNEFFSTEGRINILWLRQVAILVQRYKYKHL